MRLGDRRLAGAGRTVEEHGAVGVEGGAELVEQLVGHHEIGERDLQHLSIDVDRQGLSRDDGAVVDERDRCGAGIARHRSPVLGPLLAEVGEGDLIVAAHHSEDLELLLLPQLLDDLVDQTGGERERLRERTHRRLALEQTPTQDEVGHEREGDAEVLGGLRRA